MKAIVLTLALSLAGCAELSPRQRTAIAVGAAMVVAAYGISQYDKLCDRPENGRCRHDFNH